MSKPFAIITPHSTGSFLASHPNTGITRQGSSPSEALHNLHAALQRYHTRLQRVRPFEGFDSGHQL
jgi:predicted RNase H-like HicB family nuclease